MDQPCHPPCPDSLPIRHHLTELHRSLHPILPALPVLDHLSTPNWYLTPCAFMILNAFPHRMLLNMFLPMSIRVTPRLLLGSDRSTLFGTGTIWPSCHSSKSVSSSQYLLNKSRMWVRLSLLSALNKFGGTFFIPGALLVVKFVTTAFSSSHNMGW